MSQNPETKFMRLAIAKAYSGICRGQTPFGACIVKNKRVVAAAHNSVWKNTDITAHAEIKCIRKACKKLKTIDLSGCTIYSTCEPCPMCFSACHWARISRIVFGARIADAQKIGFHELSISNTAMKKQGKSPLKITADFLRSENIALFNSWLKKTSRKAY